jgi:hypothetical protein
VNDILGELHEGSLGGHPDVNKPRTKKWCYWIYVGGMLRDGANNVTCAQHTEVPDLQQGMQHWYTINILESLPGDKKLG